MSQDRPAGRSRDMRPEPQHLSRFEAIRDRDEEIYWIGKPAFIPFILTGLPYLILGFFWGALDYFGFIRHLGEIPDNFVRFIAIPFFALHLAPFWLSILQFLRLLLVYDNTFYAFSNKRLVARSGFWGIDFRTVDYDKISDLEVNVNPIEFVLGVGTIRAYSGRTSLEGARVYERFIAVPNPYDVFKRIKETCVDVKTDWSYPNALRAKENPGYRTHYRGRTQ